MKRILAFTVTVACLVTTVTPVAAADPAGAGQPVAAARMANAQGLRRAAGLDASPALVVASFQDPGYTSDDAGIPLSRDEAAQFNAVLRAQQALGVVADRAAGFRGFAGSFTGTRPSSS